MVWGTWWVRGARFCPPGPSTPYDSPNPCPASCRLPALQRPDWIRSPRCRVPHRPATQRQISRSRISCGFSDLQAREGGGGLHSGFFSFSFLDVVAATSKCCTFPRMGQPYIEDLEAGSMGEELRATLNRGGFLACHCCTSSTRGTKKNPPW
jgi:hypothetical protein